MHIFFNSLTHVQRERERETKCTRADIELFKNLLAEQPFFVSFYTDDQNAVPLTIQKVEQICPAQMMLKHYSFLAFLFRIILHHYPIEMYVKKFQYPREEHLYEHWIQVILKTGNKHYETPMI